MVLEHSLQLRTSRLQQPRNSCGSVCTGHVSPFLLLKQAEMIVPSVLLATQQRCRDFAPAAPDPTALANEVPTRPPRARRTCRREGLARRRVHGSDRASSIVGLLGRV